MSDDALIAGAAAPVGSRWIRSTAVLDAGWVAVSATALIVSSFFALIDLPATQLRTGADPLRVFVVGLPVVAVVVALFGAIRRSVVIVALATGTLAPGVALAGSLGVSLLLSDASAFADVGVAVSLAAALVGVTLLVRWFVYHPLPLLGDQTRPVPIAGRAMVASGGVVAVVLLVTTVVGDTTWSVATFAQTVVLFTVAVVLVAAGVTRTVAAAWLGCAASVAQVAAVLVAKAEQSSIPFDSDLLLRTGVAGLIALIASAIVSAGAARRVGTDPEPSDAVDDAEPWRWHLDD